MSTDRLERLCEMDDAVTQGIKLMSFTQTLSGSQAADIRDQIKALREACQEPVEQAVKEVVEVAKPKWALWTFGGILLGCTVGAGVVFIGAWI